MGAVIGEPSVGGRVRSVSRERRSGYDRRTLGVRTFLQGGLTPRRRGGRRSDDVDRFTDWYEPHLLFLAVAILLLSVTDAFMTLTLISHGAHEANPIMDHFLRGDPQLFAAVKMALTGGGIVVLVACARARVFRVIRVSAIIHWCLLAYACLIVYEVWLLRQIA